MSSAKDGGDRDALVRRTPMSAGSGCLPQNRTGRVPEEFRAPKAYESLGGTNPRSSWTGYGDFDVRWPLRMIAATLQHGFPGATLPIGCSMWRLPLPRELSKAPFRTGLPAPSA